MIRLVEKRDKETWYALDKHLSESVFEEKVRCGQGYVVTGIRNADDIYSGR